MQLETNEEGNGTPGPLGGMRDGFVLPRVMYYYARHSDSLN